jgi:Flp pilus assembly protein TadD
MKQNWGAWIFLAALSVGCIAPRSTAWRAGQSEAVEVGSAWLEVKTENFTLVSDLDAQEASEVVANLQETYGLLGQAVFGDRSVPSFATSAVIFHDASALRQFVGDDIGGQYRPWLPNDLEPSPTVLAWGSLSPFARLLFAHELSHRFNQVALGATPPWLNEGLAEYYSTIRAGEPDAEGTSKPVLGEIDPRYMCVPDGLGDLRCYQDDRIASTTLPSAGDLVHMDWEEFYRPSDDAQQVLSWEAKRARRGHYGMAFLLVHMLMNSERDYAARFRYAMSLAPDRGKGEKLVQVVKSVPEAVLNRDLKAYLAKQIPWRQHHPAPPHVPQDLQRRPLSSVEVLVLWARLDSFKGPNDDRAWAHLRRASELAPANGEVAFWMGRHAAMRGDTVAAEARLRRSLQLSSDKPEYLYGLLDVLWGNREGAAWDEAARSEAVQQVITALVPSARTASQLNAVAMHQLVKGDTEHALTNSARACKADSSCWGCFHNRAAILFAAGQAAEAARTETEALGRLPEAAPYALAQKLERARAFYQAAATNPESVTGQPRPGLFGP